MQLDWWPINPKYINGELLGYKVLYNDVNDTSSANTAVVSPEENRLKIGGLRPGANYSFQLLAFTAKGDGAVSTNYFAKTHSGIKDSLDTNCVVQEGELTLTGLFRTSNEPQIH